MGGDGGLGVPGCNVLTRLITRKLEKRVKRRVVIERKKREEDKIWVF
jgi:hypothetical protein